MVNNLFFKRFFNILQLALDHLFLLILMLLNNIILILSKNKLFPFDKVV